MTEQVDRRRLIGVCADCGSAYAARVLSDGEVQPIGLKVCSCGCEEFVMLE